MNEFLDDIFTYDRQSDVNINGGVVIYTMVYLHLGRTFCKNSCYDGTKNRLIGQNKNLYDFDKNGNLESSALHIKSNKIEIFFRSLLANSAFLQYVGYDKPAIYPDDYMTKYIQYINFLKKTYEAKNYKFYVYLPMQQAQDAFFPKDILIRLKNSSIETIAYRRNSKLGNIYEKLTIVGDGHWSKLGNDLHSSHIADHLKGFNY